MTLTLRPIALLPVLLLAGCTTFSDVNDNLAGLLGKPLDDSIAALGSPTGERTVAGRRYIVWSTSRSGVLVVPSNATATTLSSTPVHGTCTVTLEVDKDNIVRRGDYDGSLMACQKFGKKRG